MKKQGEGRVTQKLLKVVRKNPDCSTRELAELVGDTVTRTSNKLCKMDDLGLVTCNKDFKRATWRAV